MSSWQAWVGRSEQRSDVVTSGLVTRLCATIDSSDDAEPAPQGIHWCLCLPDTPTTQLGADGHPRRDVAGAFLPPVPLPRRMWASSRVEFLAPIRRGAAIERVSTIAAIREKTGSTGPLIFVDVAHETRSDGVAAVRETQTIVYREASGSAAPFVAPRAGTASIDGDQWPHARIITPDPPLLLRYSALTFNAHRIHYDLPYARDEEGYAGLVVHGPLTATLLLDHAARLVGANRLTQFAFRGLAPAYAGESLTLVARQDGDRIALAAIGPSGDMVMQAEAQV